MDTPWRLASRTWSQVMNCWSCSSRSGGATSQTEARRSSRLAVSAAGRSFIQPFSLRMAAGFCSPSGMVSPERDGGLATLLDEVGNEVPPAQAAVVDQSGADIEDSWRAGGPQDGQRQVVIIAVSVVEGEGGEAVPEAVGTAGYFEEFGFGKQLKMIFEPADLTVEIALCGSKNVGIERRVMFRLVGPDPMVIQNHNARGCSREKGCKKPE